MTWTRITRHKPATTIGYGTTMIQKAVSKENMVFIMYKLTTPYLRLGRSYFIGNSKPPLASDGCLSVILPAVYELGNNVQKEWTKE